MMFGRDRVRSRYRAGGAWYFQDKADGVDPTLNLDFINNRYAVLDGGSIKQKSLSDIATFSRASTATYFDSAGVMQSAAVNAPRFDHDPVTLQPKGILIEEQRTNLLLRSSEFDNAYWTKQFATVTPNIAIAPDGTNSADLMTPGTSGLYRSVYTYTMSGNTLSIFAKANGFSWIAFINTAGNVGSAWFNVLNGTLGHVIPGYSASIKDVGNGWYRCSVTADSGTFVHAQYLLADSDSVNYATENGASGIYIWGAQLEAGEFPTSYIPTTTAAVTRAADSLSLPTSSWFNSSEGTFFSETNTVSSQNAAVFGAGTTTSDILRVFRQSDGAPVSQVVVAGVHQATIGMGAINWPQTSTPKIGMAYKQNDFSSTVNGNAATTDTSGNLPTVSSMTLGTSPGLPALDGSVKKFKYYPVRVSDTELQRITT